MAWEVIFYLSRPSLIGASGHDPRDYPDAHFAVRDCAQLGFTKVHKWCREECLGKWSYRWAHTQAVFDFDCKDDAMRFKLTWM